MGSNASGATRFATPLDFDTLATSRNVSATSPPAPPGADGPETIARTLSRWGDLFQTLPTYEARLQWTDSVAAR